MDGASVVSSEVSPAPATHRRRARPRIDLAAFLRLTELADYFIPFTLRAVSELGVADLLRDGPRSAADLAAATGTHPPSLYRALRALASKGIFTEVAEGEFGPTALSDLLRSDHPLSMRDAYHLMPADVAAWAELDYSLRTGEPAFDHVHGMRLWDWLAEHPEDGEPFDRGMAAMTRTELRAVSRAYDWSSVRTVVDVGGGNGTFLAGLLDQHRHLHGTLFDLPHVVARGEPVLVRAGVAERCRIVAGSFFDSVPAGAEAYVLKRIVYGWDDAHALEILRAVRRALTRESRVLLIEPMAEPGSSDAEAILDVVMLVVDGGRARSAGELESLLARAGLELVGVRPTMSFPIVEARAA